MSPNNKMARIAGLLYLVVIATGLFAEVFVRQALAVHGNALATFHNIQHSEMLYRAGFVADLCNFAVGLPGVLIMYVLLKPFGKYLARLAMFFVLVQTAVTAANLLNQLSPLLWSGTDQVRTVFSPAQLAALAAHSLNMQELGYGIGLFFFAFYCIIIGHLLFRSGLVPRVFGVLYALAGFSYLANSLVLFLSRHFANPWFPYFAGVSFLGELALCLWFIIKGVRDKPAPGETIPQSPAAGPALLTQPAR
ncbi:DUF4386 domain-containing protein [Hymenobacter terricola]|uniref:DUF4386 domain-containing protein n=1 Tax=Hymenobacter terricola TaxID=2819236 RepID=UPI001B30E0FD|nr:DUF4386 domain-containing protein [Hymenobacter terricola]